jgi:hypothetical protein
VLAPQPDTRNRNLYEKEQVKEAHSNYFSSFWMLSMDPDKYATITMVAQRRSVTFSGANAHRNPNQDEKCHKADREDNCSHSHHCTRSACTHAASRASSSSVSPPGR